MKKLFTLLATLVAATSLSVAQDSTTTKKVYWNQSVRDELFTTNSQVRVGTAISFVTTMAMVDGYIGDSYSEYFYDYPDRGFFFDVNYGYRMWEYLEVVGSFSASIVEPIYTYTVDDVTNHKELYSESAGGSVYFLTLSVRYSWLNTKWVSLYSSLGVGAMYAPQWVTYYASGKTDNRGDVFLPHIEIMPIGIRVGRKFFGYFEPFGLSIRTTLLSVGLGYRF